MNPQLISELPSIIDEASGIECIHPDTCWTHNDNDDGARIYLIRGDGTFISQRTLTDATQVDYEDLSMDNEGNLYVGDFGNNGNDREDLLVYRSQPNSASGSLAVADRIEFSLEDQTEFPPPADQRNFDIEGMVHYEGFLYLFTRNRTEPFDGVCKMYRIPDAPGTYVAELTGSFFGNFSQTYSSITSAAISPSGEKLALLTKGSIFLFNGLSDGPDTTTPPIYNFFNFTASFEGISFIDECLAYLVTESEGSDEGALYSLNTCDIVLGIDELPPLTGIRYQNGYLTFPVGQIGRLMLFDLSGRLLFESYGESEVQVPSHLPAGTYVAKYTANGLSRSLRFYHGF